jgi:hypothetical protein
MLPPSSQAPLYRETPCGSRRNQWVVDEAARVDRGNRINEVHILRSMPPAVQRYLEIANADVTNITLYGARRRIFFLKKVEH